MALEKQILEQLNSITNVLNEWQANAKRTEEFPEMTDIEADSKLRVSFETISYWVSIQDLIEFMSSVFSAPIPLTYTNTANLITNQGQQLRNYIYEVTDGSGFGADITGKAWVKYLGTFNGNLTDYTVVSKEREVYDADRVLISDSNGIIDVSDVTSTELSYVGGVSSSIQEQLDSKQSLSEKGEPNGYTPLDSGAKVPIEFLPDSVVGQVEYQGAWNASTNTPNVGDATTKKGHYYVTSVAGTYLGISYEVGDWIISNGATWQKVDNTDAVVSVFGRIGAIVANLGDYAAFYSPIITGGGSTIVSSNLTANRALLSDASGKVAVSAVTNTELGYVSGVTSSIQTQLNAKLATSSYTASDVLAKLLTVGGSGSGLDADLLDGIEASQFLRSDVTATKTAGNLVLNDGISLAFGTSTRSRMTNAGGDTFLLLFNGNYVIRDDANPRFTFERTTGNFTAAGKGIFTGTATAAPATSSAELVTKGQLDAAARPYKVYTALLSQSGTSAPTAKVLENTLGFVPTFGYSSTGVFSINSSGGFTLDKTYISFTIRNGSGTNWIGNHLWSSSSALQITSKNSGVLTNVFPSDAELEIRVYN